MKTSHQHRLRFAPVVLFSSIASLGTAQSIWDGGGADNNWTTGANWQGDTAPGSLETTAIQLSGNTRPSINVDAAFTFGSLTVNSGAGAFTLSGAELSIASKDTSGNAYSADSGNAIRNNSTSLLTINNNLKLLNSTGIYAVTGNIALTGNINLNGVADARLLAAGGRTLTIDGVISGSVSGGALAYNNGGRFEINGANTYTATTKIWTGTAVLGNAAALGSSANSVELGVNSGAQARTPKLLTSQALTIANNIRLITQTSGGSNTATIGSEHTTGTSVFSGNVIMGSNSAAGEDLAVTAAGTSRVNFTGNLQRASGATGATDTLEKTGTGIVVLSGANNTYQGTTTVEAGALLVNGTLASGGAAVTVNSGATLGGYGTINRAVNLLSGSVLEVGDNHAGATGVLTLGGATAFATGSTVKFDLGANASASDQLQINGALTLGNITFDLTTLSGFGESLSYTLLTATGGITGGLANISLTGSSLGDYALQLNGNSIHLVSSAIPEPGASALLVSGCALMGVLLRRRR